MAKDDIDERPKFFREVHALAQEEGVLAYVIVGIVRREGSISVASGAGTMLDERNETSHRLFHELDKAFDQAMVALVTPSDTTPPKSGLLN